MAGRIFGIDFGTTNSLVSYIDPTRQVAVDLTDTKNERPHPSVVWYRGGSVVVGAVARGHLDSGSEAVSGDFVRSPKRLLAGEAPIHVAGRQIDPVDIVAEVFQFLVDDAGAKTRGRNAQEVDQAVVTIPVDLNGAGRRRLRRAARKAGVSVVQFVHEPLAALYGYLRGQADWQARTQALDGQRMLVFDWGGGTLDLTLCTVDQGRLVQLASLGDNSIGGDAIDEKLRNFVRARHAAEHGLKVIVEADGAVVRLLGACEQAKIALSIEDDYPIHVGEFLRSDPGRALNVVLTKIELEEIAGDIIQQGLGLIDRLLEENRLTYLDIGLCLPTGGVVNMPMVREGLLQRFGGRTAHINTGDRIIAQGAAWIAHDGVQLKMAKPLELLLPDGAYMTLIDAGIDLPTADSVLTISRDNYYCVDPRDGVAHFEFARPTRVGPTAARSPRRIYGALSVAVDPTARVFVERLKLDIIIDGDYVVGVKATSLGRGDIKPLEIHDLEFALALPTALIAPAEGLDRRTARPDETAGRPTDVVLRTNVVEGLDWLQIPGDILTTYKPTAFSHDVTARQMAERYYYQPCATCRRLEYQCKWEGCDHPVCVAQGMTTRAQAARAPAVATSALAPKLI